MTRFQNLNFFIILLFFVCSGYGQTDSNNDTKWTQIKDDKLNFSILFPSDFLVDNEIEKSYIIAPVLASLPEVITYFEKPKIIGNEKSVQMSLSVYQLRQVSNAKNYLWFFIGRDSPKSNYQDFGNGDFVGRITTYDTEKRLAMTVAIAIKNKIYLINASAKNEDEKTYKKFVTSLMLNGESLFKSQTSEIPKVSQNVFITALRTSPEILQTLNRKQENYNGRIVENTVDVEEKDNNEQNFSRPLILLRRPDFDFIDSASRNDYSGLVRLKVIFSANGTIGDIFVSNASDGLTKLAVKAAQKIIFLPAESEGRKVDVTRTIVYAYNVK